MKLNLIVLAIGLIAASCSPEKKKEIQDEKVAEEKIEVIEAPVTNVPSLTDDQKKQGWKLLFDGKSMQGWRPYRSKPNDSWEVIDGTLHCKPFADNVENKRGDLITTDEYENYELTWEWKVAPKGNSGVIYRVTEEFDQSYTSGPEYQMFDDLGADGKIADWQKSGGCFGLYAPINAKPKPVGEWNASKLIINRNHVEHWLNGTKVVSYDIESTAWQTKKDASKWNEAKKYGLAKKAHIDLQDHFSEAWFRNIVLRAL